MNKQIATTDLPAPLSLTLDETNQVGGGYSLAVSQVNLLIPNWLWFGQPPIPVLSGLQTAIR